MSKTSVTQWDTVASNNTDINGINIAELCPAGGINDAIRTLMAQMADFVAAPTFSGPIKRSSQFYIDIIGGKLIINFKLNCYLSYDPAVDKLTLVINALSVASIEGGGNLAIRGTLFQNTTP